MGETLRGPATTSGQNHESHRRLVKRPAAQPKPKMVAANGTNGTKADVEMGHAWPSSDNGDAKPNKKKEHLVVMVHGLFGSYKHLDAMVKAMKTRLATRDDVEIFVSRKNGGAKTLDGIQK